MAGRLEELVRRLQIEDADLIREASSNEPLSGLWHLREDKHIGAINAVSVLLGFGEIDTIVLSKARLEELAYVAKEFFQQQIDFMNFLRDEPAKKPAPPELVPGQRIIEP